MAYNVFETFRGGEAAYVYGRLMATVRWLFDVREYTIHPYQLGDGNDEGLDSGAWWFYYKLGFRPRAARAKTLVARELARIARNPAYRTARGTLEHLVRDRLYWAPEPTTRADIIEPLRLDRIGLAITARVDKSVSASIANGRRRCVQTRRPARCGVANWRTLGPRERVAWTRWAPLVAVLPGVADWSRDERPALADVIRAKGGRYEGLREAIDAHARLRQAVAALSRGARA